jgi:hypothetical protein
VAHGECRARPCGGRARDRRGGRNRISGDTRRIRIRIDGLPRLEGNSLYELWIARDPAHRVSLGVFRPDAQGRIDTTVEVPNLGPAWQGIWLTHEPGSGRPGWSKDWVLAGHLA